jgi:hypothetical protein
MFGAAEKELHGGGLAAGRKRRDQLKWRTLVIKICKNLQSSGDNTAG